MKTETTVIMNKYKNSIFSIAFNICGNPTDADDVVQDVFIQYHITDKQFESEQHIRAWLIRVAINKAKNTKLSFWHKKTVPLEDYMETLTFPSPDSRELFETVMKLPAKYRIVLHLFYYEDFSIKEISELLHISESNSKVRSQKFWLCRIYKRF